MSDQPRVFGGKPVAICGATPGRLGTALAQTAWLPVLRVLGASYFPKQLLLPGAMGAFADDGRLEDENQRERVAAFVADFAAHCRG